MNAGFPDRETIHTALSLATRAPSVHNSQPWRWRVTEHTVHLYADLGLHLQSTDPDSRVLILSCGLSLHYCVVAFAALGWQTKAHRLPNPSEPEHLAALELYRHPANAIDVTLAAAIPRRRTDRRHCCAWPVPPADIGLMSARAARAGVMLRQVESLPELRQIVAQAAWQHAMDRDYLSELTTWSGRYASVAGVPAHNTPTPDPTAPLPGRFFAGPALAQPKDTESAADNAVVLALGTKDDSLLARLRAGEATSVVLLTATALGLASCPITVSMRFHRCCCASVGRRLTLIRCRPHHAARSRTWSTGCRSPTPDIDGSLFAELPTGTPIATADHARACRRTVRVNAVTNADISELHAVATTAGTERDG